MKAHFHHQQRLSTRRNRILPHDAEIYASVAHGIGQAAAAMRLRQQRGAAEKLADGWQRWHGKPLQHACSSTDDEGPRLPGLLTMKIFEILQLAANQFCQPPASRGERERLAFAAREFGTKELFQFADLPTDLALSVRVVWSRFRDAALLRHLHETEQPVERQAAFGEEVIKHDCGVSDPAFTDVLQ